jgi:Protein of unknown function (DUF2939)
MRTLSKLIALFIFIAAGAWFYLAPYGVLRDMQAAAHAKDAGKLASHINFPAVKDSVKTSLGAKFSNSAKDSNNPLAALGAALASSIINPLVDALVTPDTVALMLTRGEKPKKTDGPAPGPAPQPAPGGDPAPNAQSPKETETHASYESFDRFVVTVRRVGSTEQPLGLVFLRDGLIGWKLSALRLPL